MSCQYCFICASDEGIFLDIFTSGKNFRDKIETCLSIKIQKSKIASTKVCHKCAYELEQCSKFVEKYKKTTQTEKGKLFRKQGHCSLCMQPGKKGFIFDLINENPLNNPQEKIHRLFDIDFVSGNFANLSICLDCRYNLDVLFDLKCVLSDHSDSLKKIFNGEVKPVEMEKIRTHVIKRKTTSIKDLSSKLSEDSTVDTESDTNSIPEKVSTRLRSMDSKVNTPPDRKCEECHSKIPNGVDMYRYHNSGKNVCKECFSKSDKDEINRGRKRKLNAETKPCCVFLEDIFTPAPSTKKPNIQTDENGGTIHIISDDSANEENSPVSKTNKLSSAKRKISQSDNKPGKKLRSERTTTNQRSRSNSVQSDVAEKKVLRSTRARSVEVIETKIKKPQPQKKRSSLPEKKIERKLRTRPKRIDISQSSSEESINKKTAASSKKVGKNVSTSSENSADEENQVKGESDIDSRPYKCNICNNDFENRVEGLTHELTHSKSLGVVLEKVSVDNVGDESNGHVKKAVEKNPATEKDNDNDITEEPQVKEVEPAVSTKNDKKADDKTESYNKGEKRLNGRDDSSNKITDNEENKNDKCSDIADIEKINDKVDDSKQNSETRKENKDKHQENEQKKIENKNKDVESGNKDRESADNDEEGKNKEEENKYEDKENKNEDEKNAKKEEENKKSKNKDEENKNIDKESKNKDEENKNEDKESKNKDEENKNKDKASKNKDEENKNKDKESQNKDEKNKNKDKESKNKVEENKNKDKESQNKDEKSKNEDKESKNKVEENKNKDKESQNKDEKSKNEDKESKNKDEENKNKDKESKNKVEENKNQDKESQNKDEKNKNKDKKSKNKGEESVNKNEENKNKDKESQNKDETNQNKDNESKNKGEESENEIKNDESNSKNEGCINEKETKVSDAAGIHENEKRNDKKKERMAKSNEIPIEEQNISKNIDVNEEEIADKEKNDENVNIIDEIVREAIGDSNDDEKEVESKSNEEQCGTKDKSKKNKKRDGKQQKQKKKAAESETNITKKDQKTDESNETSEKNEKVQQSEDIEKQLKDIHGISDEDETEQKDVVSCFGMEKDLPTNHNDDDVHNKQKNCVETVFEKAHQELTSTAVAENGNHDKNNENTEKADNNTPEEDVGVLVEREIEKMKNHRINELSAIQTDNIDLRNIENEIELDVNKGQESLDELMITSANNDEV